MCVCVHAVVCEQRGSSLCCSLYFTIYQCANETLGSFGPGSVQSVYTPTDCMDQHLGGSE